MKYIYVLVHQYKSEIIKLTRQLIEVFLREGIGVVVEKWLYDKLPLELRDLTVKMDASNCQFIVALGGDGTILRANRLAVRCGIPLLGVNVGREGFLTEIEMTEIEMAAQRMKNDDYEIENRKMLSINLGSHNYLALNDIALNRGNYARLIDIRATVGNQVVGDYIGDGLIVSTPTGSTGYSLSAGGPIVSPIVSCMILTPVCAHSLQHRPVVLSAEDEVVIELHKEHTGKALLSIDGRALSLGLGSDEQLKIKIAKETAKFIRFHEPCFFERVRCKLSEWSH